MSLGLLGSRRFGIKTTEALAFKIEQKSIRREWDTLEIERSVKVFPAKLIRVG